MDQKLSNDHIIYIKGKQKVETKKKHIHVHVIESGSKHGCDHP